MTDSLSWDDIGLLLEITAELVPQVLLDGIGIDELGRRDRGDHAYEVQLGGFPPRDPGPDLRLAPEHLHRDRGAGRGVAARAAARSRPRCPVPPATVENHPGAPSLCEMAISWRILLFSGNIAQSP